MPPTIEELKELKITKAKVMSSMLFSTRYMFKNHHKRKFVIGDHHRIICKVLDDVINGKLTRVIINIAPRYGKTEVAVKQFIARGLGINPAAKFIHLSYSDTLALDNSEEVRDIVQEPYYQALFPNVQIKPDTKAKKKWYTTAGGGVYATSTGGQITGFGAGNVQEDEDDIFADDDFPMGGELFGGAIIIDDAIKPEDADSEVKRERINMRFDSTIRSRVNSRLTPIVVIMQRVDPRDLCGYLMEKEPGVWTVISLPCINEENNAYGLPAGKALWDFKHTLAELDVLREINELVFERQYMQKQDSQKGKLLPKDQLHFYNPTTVDVKKLAEYVLLIIDPADEGGDDLSAPLGYLIGNKIYIEHVIYNNDGTDINEPACAELIIDRKVNAVDIEGNSAWILFVKRIRALIESRAPDTEVRSHKSTTNKHTRILAMASFIKNNFVFRSDYASIPAYKKFMDNCTNYNKDQSGINKNKKDDGIDSAAMMARHLLTNFAHLWEANAIRE